MNKIENKSYYYIKKRGSSYEKSFLPKITLIFRQFFDFQFYTLEYKIEFSYGALLPINNFSSCAVGKAANRSMRCSRRVGFSFSGEVSVGSAAKAVRLDCSEI